MKKYESHKNTISLSRTKEYQAWTNMRQRCNNVNRPDYVYYGARGIKVCEEWADSFTTFFNNMGKCPPGKSLDRKNNSLNYSPSNCRWATKDEQMQNTRATHLIEYKGCFKGLAAWSRELGINKESLRCRLTKMSVEQAFTLPAKKDNRRITTNLNTIL